MIRKRKKKRLIQHQMIINSKKRDTTVGIQIAHYNHFKEKADPNNQNFLKIS